MKTTIYNNLSKFLFLSSVLFIFSCKEKEAKKIRNFQDAEFSKIAIPNRDIIGHSIVYTFFKNGDIKEIHRYNKGGQYEGEQLWFYNDGILKRKFLAKNGKANGNDYYFYDSTGTLYSHVFYKNDIPTFFGVNYWNDSIAMMIKAIVSYGDSGKIEYKKNFDKQGIFIYIEGK